MNELPDSIYVISLEEVLWGGLLMAISMTIHGFGMLAVLRVNNAVIRRLESKKTLVTGMFPVILASCMILFVHLIEVMVWAIFFLWRDAFPNRSVAFYFSLNEYTTVGSSLSLPQRWHLLEGMIAIAGLLAFAWSTGVLITLAQRFQEHQMDLFNARHRKKSIKSKTVHDKTSDGSDAR
jgi:preprotein translocase subunit SecY